jgi:hypothetical protein
MPHGWEAVTKRIADMTVLAQNWDSYGAVPPSVTTAKRALDLCSVLVNSNWIPATSVIPGDNGSIIMSWMMPTRHLDFTVREDDPVLFNALTLDTGEQMSGQLENF